MTTPHARTRRLAAVVLAVAAFAALLPAGASAAAPARARDAAPAAAVDSLWAAMDRDIAACADPTSPASLATCFTSGGTTARGSQVVTDGTNVFARHKNGGAWSCPVAGLGADCTRVMAGPWGTTDASKALAAAAGSLWIGQLDGTIFRCPADLPWQSQSTPPAVCDWIEDFGVAVNNLLLANGLLYVGLDDGKIWFCDPYTPSTCSRLDDAGGNPVLALAAGAGSLWAGLKSGIIWRCHPYYSDQCETWDTGGGSIASLSYDGSGTLYAAVDLFSQRRKSAIWSCPVATKDACSEVIPDVEGVSVAAGAGSVFSSNTTSLDHSLYFGATPFTGASISWQMASLLYIPAGGLPALGAANVQVRFPEVAKRLAARCADGVPLIAHVRVTGPNDFRWKRTVDACRIRNPKMPDVRLGLLDPGTYYVRVRTPKHEAEGSVVVTGDSTHPLILQLLGRR